LSFRLTLSLWAVCLVFACPCAGVAAEASANANANARAREIAAASPAVMQAMGALHRMIGRLEDPRVRAITHDALERPDTCIAHRRNLTQGDRLDILNRLIHEGLIEPPGADPTARTRLMAGVFPPVDGDGGDCPRLAQPFYAAPGGDAAGHHAWPGGLALHTALNAQIGYALVRAYGAQSRQSLDADRVVIAALWHDWAKTMVFQWTSDGSETAETSLGGAGGADDDGKPGDSRTGAHHILGLAEAMSRGLSAGQIVVQACAHAQPTDGEAYKIANWLRAAAIIARVDPVARGYLRPDSQGRLRPVFAEAGAVASARDGPWSAECLIHHQSDQNWTFAEPALRAADLVLERLAPRFGYDPNDSARYRNRYRNVVLAQLGADRVQRLNGAGGLSAVAAELDRLRRRGAI
jgi:hypothetical protein